MSSSVLVIGLGNRLRGDDGVGAVVADTIRARNIPGLDAVAFDGDGAMLLDRWRGAKAVIIVDALRSEGAPGSLQRFDARQPLPATRGTSSTHGFGLAEAIEMARALDALPPTLQVYGVVSASCGLGEALSPSVAAAVPHVVESVVREALALTDRG